MKFVIWWNLDSDATLPLILLEKETSVIQQMTQWILELMVLHGPLMVFVGVIIESVIVPIPSPLIIMTAGALLIEPTLSLSSALGPILLKIVVPGAIASTIGAYFTFGLAFWGGKPLIDRFERFLGFNWDDVLKMEPYFVKRVGPMIFLLRALPIIPLSLISAVAGVLRIPVWVFTFWTFLGSLPRCLILGYLGYLMRDTYEGFAGKLNSLESFFSLGIVAVVCGFILWLRFRMKKKTSNR